MRLKKFILPFYLVVIAGIAGAVLLSIFGVIPGIDFDSLLKARVLGEQTAQIASPEVVNAVPSPAGNAVSDLQAAIQADSSGVTEVMPVVPTQPAGSIGILSSSKELNEGEIASFTWFVSGSANPIKTTTVYYGKTSVPGKLDTTVSPSSVGYTEWVRDFINGTYKIPLTFTASKIVDKEGVYYGRAYAEVEGKHIWSDEISFIVRQKPKNEIKIVGPPTNVKSNEGVTFTWDIIGPNATTGYTVIAGGKQPYPGPVDEKTALTLTPYSVLIGDFTHGTINVPLRFIGTTRITDTGTYYFRALAFIDGKNIWSDEYSFTVSAP